MNLEEKIVKSMDLQRIKEEKIRELKEVTALVQDIEDNCEHILVYLGCFDFADTQGKCRCVMCGKMEESLYYDPKYVIHAENYLPEYDTTTKEGCEAKFDAIQILARGFLRERPNQTLEELTTRMNSLIQESITYREEQNKTRNLKMDI